MKSGTRKLDVTREDLQKLIEAGTVNLYDVREPDEVKASGAIPNAINIPCTLFTGTIITEKLIMYLD